MCHCEVIPENNRWHITHPKTMYRAQVPGHLSTTGEPQLIEATTSGRLAEKLNIVLKKRPKLRPVTADNVKDYFNRPDRTKQLKRKLGQLDMHREW